MSRYWGIAVLAMSSLSHAVTPALELQDSKALEEAGHIAFVSVQNVASLPVSLMYSNGEQAELGEGAGRLLPCASVQGLTLFIHAGGGDSGQSATLECGHAYTVRSVGSGEGK